MAQLLLVAYVFGVVSVVLAIRRSLWNFPFGLAITVFYGFGYARLPLWRGVVEQGLYFVVLLWGAWEWRRSIALHGAVRIARIRGREVLAWLLAAVAVFAIWGEALIRFTYTQTPWAEATIATLGLVAQAMIARRRVETWPLWLVADLLAFVRDYPMMAHRSDLRVLIFPALALVGWFVWRRAAIRALVQRLPAPGNFQTRT